MNLMEIRRTFFKHLMLLKMGKFAVSDVRFKKFTWDVKKDEKLHKVSFKPPIIRP